MRQLEKNDKSSKSLLANVLDLEDDFLVCSTGKPDGPNQLPNFIPHSATFPHPKSDVNISPVAIDPSLCPNNSHNFTQYLGMTKILGKICKTFPYNIFFRQLELFYNRQTKQGIPQFQELTLPHRCKME